MISRTTTIALAEAYATLFAGAGDDGWGSLDGKRLHDFLYEHDWQPWALGEVKRLRSAAELREWIMGLHTGDALASYPTRIPAERLPEVGQMLLRQLCRDALSWADERDGDYAEEVKREVARLLRLLELDGYAWEEGRLLHSEADELEAETEAGVLETLVRELALPKQEVLERHLARSEGYYLEGEWEDSCAHSRRFLEAVLRETAARHHHATRGAPLDPRVHSRPAAVRGYLQSEGLISPQESETLAAVLEMLSWTESPAYTSPREHARLARRLALTLAQLPLLRLKRALTRRVELPGGAASAHPGEGVQ